MFKNGDSLILSYIGKVAAFGLLTHLPPVELNNILLYQKLEVELGGTTHKIS